MRTLNRLTPPFMKSHQEKGMEGTLIVTNAHPD